MISIKIQSCDCTTSIFKRKSTAGAQLLTMQSGTGSNHTAIVSTVVRHLDTTTRSLQSNTPTAIMIWYI